MRQERLTPIIPVLLRYSEAKQWEDAKIEWYLVDIRLADREYAETCACGHYPICEICKIKNEVNNTRLEVGNCCINQVSDEFDALRRIFPALRDGRINPAVIDYAHKRKIINDWERNFLTNTWKKKHLSLKQTKIFGKIRYKLYNGIEISPDQRKKIYEKWQGTKQQSSAPAPKEATAQ